MRTQAGLQWVWGSLPGWEPGPDSGPLIPGPAPPHTSAQWGLCGSTRAATVGKLLGIKVLYKKQTVMKTNKQHSQAVRDAVVSGLHMLCPILLYSTGCKAAWRRPTVDDLKQSHTESLL